MLSSLKRSPPSTAMSSGDLSSRATLTFAQELQLGAVLAYHADLLLCAALLFIFMFNVPRMLARFARVSDWTKGHTLYHSSNPGPKPSIPPHRSASHARRAKTPASSQGLEAAPSSASAYSYSQSVFTYTHPHYKQQEAIYPSFPPHVRSWASLLPRLTPMARFRLNSGFSIGQSAILLLYTGVMIYCSLYRSNPFTDPLRTGFVAMSQIPFVYAFAGKNNIVGLLIGYGYEKINYLHRYAGQVIVVLSDIHALGFIYEWSLNGTFHKYTRQPSIIWGFIALACVNVLYLTSTSFWRHKLHTTFLTTHFVSFVIFLPAITMHGPLIRPYALAGVGIYGFDVLFRVIKTRLCTARLVPMPSLSMTRVEVGSLNAGWRAGQHVRLRVLSFHMGWLGWTESHPFTIASVAGDGGLVLLCKRAGDWTEKLYALSKHVGYGDEGAMESAVKVIVEGPYGGPGYTVFASYSAAVFVVGGSGITFALAALQELVQVDLAGKSRVKIIELIWSVQDPTSLVPLLPLFSALLEQSQGPSLSTLRIQIHYTRASGSPLPPKESLPQGLTLSSARPKLGKALDSVLARCVSLGAGIKDDERITGVVVGVCGPVGMGDDVVKAVGKLEERRRRAVGGVEVHEEVFGW